MNEEYKLIAAVIVANENKFKPYFPAFPRLIFKKGKDFYVQVCVSGPYPHTVKEEVDYTLFKHNYLTNSSLDEKVIELDDSKFQHVDKSKKLYCLALSENTLIIANLLEFTDYMNNLKQKDPMILEAKASLNERRRQVEKRNFSTNCKFMLETIEKSEEANLTL